MKINLQPKQELTEEEVKRGLKLVIGDGLAAEAMTTFTGGAFLVAMALLLGASNLQIGVLAGLPTFTHLFQLISIWLVRRYNNRRAVTVVSSLLARVPLVVIGIVAFFFSSSSSVDLLIFFLFFNYLFGAIAGPSWNSWMKDIVPEQTLGAYFSKRTSYVQALNVVLSLLLALAVDFVKNRYPEWELKTYAIMFAAGGIVGIIGAFVLSRVQEPKSEMTRANIFRLLQKPLKDTNFQRLLIFNSAWTFAISMATPFFTVFMMKSIGLSLSLITALNILSQLSSILTIRMWGTFADKYSNKTIIAIGAPLYILSIIAWCFVGLYANFYTNILLLSAIHIVMGVATAGINLSITNLGLKLAPKENAIVYLTARNMVVAVFASIAPLIGGQLADYFMDRSLVINAEWSSPTVQQIFHLVSLREWNFLFLIGALLAIVSLELLVHVNEVGEVEKGLVRRIMRHSIKSRMRDFFVVGALISWNEQLLEVLRRRLRFIKSAQRKQPG